MTLLLKSPQRESPFRCDDISDLAGIANLIKTWTRTALNLSRSTVISVNELACGQPGCPPRQSVILVLTNDHPPLKLAIHKGLREVVEADVYAEVQRVEKISAC